MNAQVTRCCCITLAVRIVFLSGSLMLAESAMAKDPVVRTHEVILKTFRDEFVAITPGEKGFPKTFEMGSKEDASEKPVCTVEMTSSFSIAKYEVTQELYQTVMNSNPSRWKGPRNSVEMMTWDEARKFCAKVTLMLREQKLITSKQTVRLPTESEWEYCCRAGTQTAYSFGEKARTADDDGKRASLLDPYAWHTGNAAGNDPPVGALKPNPWGLYDMHGYLDEFCQDAWSLAADRGKNAPAPFGNPAKSGFCVIRGGSWKQPWNRLRSAARSPMSIEGVDDAVGFRCVLQTD